MLAQPRIRLAQIELRFDIVGLLPQSFVQRRKRFVGPVEREKQIAEIVVDVRLFGALGQRTAVEIFRLGRAVLCAPDQSQQLQRIGLFRAAFEDLLQQSFRLHEIVGIEPG